METCANCDRKIGKLETPRLWRGKVVCEACDRMLQHSKPPAPPAKRSLAPVYAILLTVGGAILACVFQFGRPMQSESDNVNLGALFAVAFLVGFLWYAILRVMGRA